MNKFVKILKDAITTNAYAMARTYESDPLQSFMFKVTISGLETGVGFQKVAGISREVAVVEYLENMYNHKHKLPGRESVGEITFERGMYKDAKLKNLYTKIFNSSNKQRSTVIIEVCDRFGTVRRKFECAECWFSKYEVSDLDATSDDVIIETLTMQFEYFL